VTAFAAVLVGALAFSLNRHRPSGRLRAALAASFFVTAASVAAAAGQGEASLSLAVGGSLLLIGAAVQEGRQTSTRVPLAVAVTASLLTFSLALLRPWTAGVLAAASWLVLALLALRLKGLTRLLVPAGALAAAAGSATGLPALSPELSPPLAILGSLGTLLSIAAWPIARMLGLVGELSRREREAESLALKHEATSSFRRTVAGCARPAELLGRSLDVLVSWSGAEVAGVILRRGEGEMEIAAHRNASPAILEELRRHPLRSDEGLLAPVMEEGLVVHEDPFDNPRLSRSFPVMDGWRSLLMAPLVARGQVIGALALAARVPGAFDAQVAELVEEVGETLGLHLEESRSRQRLERQGRLSQEMLQRAGLIVVGLDPALRVSVFNRAAEEATGYRAEEVMGESFPERFLPAELRERERARHRSFFEGGESPEEQLGAILTRDGRRLRIRWRYALLPGDRLRPARLLALGLDVGGVRDQAGQAAPEREAKTPAAAGAGEGAAGRILVVDDEETVLEVLQECLGRAGYQVDRARNGREALDRLRGADYRGIISDMRMPGMSGPELYEILSRRWPRLAPHVLFLTGDTNHPRSWEFIERTGCAYLEKPFEIQELLSALQRVLRSPGAGGARVRARS
jgi:PAS domain S-box-containing protein